MQNIIFNISILSVSNTMVRAFHRRLEKTQSSMFLFCLCLVRPQARLFGGYIDPQRSRVAPQ